MNDIGATPEQNPTASPSRFAIWIVLISPVILGIWWVLSFLIHDKYAWSDWYVAFGMLVATLVGFIGGVALAVNRRNAWWVLISLASIGLAYLLWRVYAAIGLGPLH